MTNSGIITLRRTPFAPLHKQRLLGNSANRTGREKPDRAMKEEDPMQAKRHSTFVFDESFDERASRELIKLIRKLRWIGKEDEARDVERKLRATLACDCVLAVPGETD